MDGQSRYQIDRNRIIFEQFDDETVLVNTETGFYYAISNTGSEILQILENGFTVEEMLEVLFYNSSEINRLQAIVEKFVIQIESEGIIVPRTVERSSRKMKDEGRARHGRGIDYVPPTFDRFDDVRELLLIDPVHQVDQDYGWPHATPIDGRSAAQK